MLSIFVTVENKGYIQIIYDRLILDRSNVILWRLKLNKFEKGLNEMKEK